VGAGEVIGHGLGEVTQRLLLHHLAALGQPPVLGPGLGQLGGLGAVAGRVTAAGPPPGLLLDGQVPHVPGVRTVLPQEGLLHRCWDQTVAGHDSNLLSNTDVSEEVKRRSSPAAKAGVSAPRIR